MRAPVRVSDLRHRVTIEEVMRASDGGGGFDVTWNEVAVVWAAIWTRGVDERVDADRVAGRATHDIWIRFRDGVKPEMRFREGARVFDILGVIDVDDRRAWLRCPVEEIDL